MEAAAMVCFLALLFPVISLTDDLHPEIAVVDAASGKRNACLVAASASHVRSANISREAHFTFALIARPFVGIHLESAEGVSVTKGSDSGSFSTASSGRSPPRLL
jgi:hypothetical protein